MQAGATPVVQAHFVGSLVFIAAEENNARISRWLLIDGQQRLTTIILLLTAVRDLLVANPEASASSAILTADEISDIT